MVWFKVDDNLAFHRKAVAAGNAAMGLWTRAGSWCAQQLTDGHVPADIAASMGTRGEIARLLKVKLWVPAEDGYQFWQWNDEGRQPTREQVEADRRAATERQRKAREAARSRRDADRDKASDNTVTNSATHAEVQPPSRSPRPDPTRPVSTSVADQGGSVAEPNARDQSPPKRPNQRCPRHATLPAHQPIPDCGACADARRAHDAWSPPTPADRPLVDVLAAMPEADPDRNAAGRAQARANLEASRAVRQATA